LENCINENKKILEESGKEKELRDKLSEKGAIEESLRKQIEDLKKELDENEGNEIKEKELRDKLSEKGAIEESLRKQIEDLKKELDENEGNKVKEKELRDKLSEKEEIEENLRKDLELKELEQNILEDQLENCRNENKKILKELENCNDENKSENEKTNLEECEEEKGKIKEKLTLYKKLRDCDEEKESLRKQIEDFKEKLEGCKEKQINDEEKESLRKQIANLKEKLEDYKEKQIDDEEDDYKITDDSQVPKFINDKLEPAIPRSSRIEVYNQTKKFITNKSEEISELIPSKILLKNSKENGFVLKIFNEILMTNFWHGNSSNYGLYNEWAPNTLDYSYRGNYGVNQRLKTKFSIREHETDAMQYTRILYNSKNETYFDKVYNIIEEYLIDHGVNCTIEKAFVPTNNAERVASQSKKVFLAVGSLPFFNLKSKKSSTKNNLYYYLQINFDIRMKSNNQVYPIRGFTMLLSDELDLYTVKI
ncbi:MAG: hypothetical protein REH79_03700, partial [Spiroplasma sp.]|nr:hypothetical protein [Spiroplasma sp.]